MAWSIVRFSLTSEVFLCADAAWETVGTVAPDEGQDAGYREITKQLQSLDSDGLPAAQRPPGQAGGSLGSVGDPAAASPGVRRISGAFTRTLDMFGWGAAGKGPAREGSGIDELALQQQVGLQFLTWHLNVSFVLQENSPFEEKSHMSLVRL